MKLKPAQTYQFAFNLDELNIISNENFHFFPAIIHKKYLKKHFNVVCLFFNKIGELNGFAISTLSPIKKNVIKTNLLRAA